MLFDPFLPQGLLYLGRQRLVFQIIFPRHPALLGAHGRPCVQALLKARLRWRLHLVVMVGRTYEMTALIPGQLRPFVDEGRQHLSFCRRKRPPGGFIDPLGSGRAAKREPKREHRYCCACSCSH